MFETKFELKYAANEFTVALKRKNKDESPIEEENYFVDIRRYNPQQPRGISKDGVYVAIGLLNPLRKALLKLNKVSKYETKFNFNKEDEHLFTEIIKNGGKEMLLELIGVKYDHLKEVFFEEAKLILVLSKTSSYQSNEVIRKDVRLNYCTDLKTLIKGLQEMSRQYDGFKSK
jgi:hypothetical protein